MKEIKPKPYNIQKLKAAKKAITTDHICLHPLYKYVFRIAFYFYYGMKGAKGSMLNIPIGQQPTWHWKLIRQISKPEPVLLVGTPVLMSRCRIVGAEISAVSARREKKASEGTVACWRGRHGFKLGMKWQANGLRRLVIEAWGGRAGQRVRDHTMAFWPKTHGV